jgi:hypothetical protein
MATLRIGGTRLRLRRTLQLAGMGEQYTPDKLLADVNAVIAELVTRLQADQTNGALYRLLEIELTRARQFQSTGLAPATLAVRAAALEAIRNETKLAYIADPNSLATPARRQAAAQAAGDVLRWYAGVTGQALKQSNARAAVVTDVVAAIKNAPKAVVGWGLEALGLPKWILPVGLVVAGLVVAAPYVAPMLGQAAGGYARKRAAP